MEEPAQVTESVSRVAVQVLLGLVPAESLALEISGISPAAFEGSYEHLAGWIDLQGRTTFDE
jgi:hypothetical protein